MATKKAQKDRGNDQQYSYRVWNSSFEHHGLGLHLERAAIRSEGLKKVLLAERKPAHHYLTSFHPDDIIKTADEAVVQFVGDARYLIASLRDKISELHAQIANANAGRITRDWEEKT